MESVGKAGSIQAVAETVRDEMIATNTVSAYGAICRLLVVYQPGGLGEKGVVLRALEEPVEAATIPEALKSLRKWLRWRRRASEMNLALPDPTVMMRGLSKMIRKAVETNRELKFRISLARNTLRVDSVPTHGTVQQFAEHVLETEKEQATGRRDLVCRFYMKDTGCRKGRSCEWQHPTDETARGRCWECGSVEHMRKDCPRKQKPTSPEKPAAVRRVAQENDVATTPASASSPKKEEIKPTREKETVVEDSGKDKPMGGGGVAGSSKDATEPQRLAGSQKGGREKQPLGRPAETVEWVEIWVSRGVE